MSDNIVMARKLPRISVVLCLIFFFILISKGAEELKIVTNKSKCIHGTISQKGNCVCKPCWTGESCDEPVNRHRPEFGKQKYELEVETLFDDGKPLFTPDITDDDKETTCKGRTDCACAEVTFSIVDGNKDSTFTIDPSTGSLFVSKGSYLFDDKYTVTISVNNNIDTDVERKLSQAKVVIVTKQGDKHHIVKRSATSVVTNVTFDLTKKEPYTNTTSMKVGSRVRFQLQITFPIGSTDMLVELFTPDNDTTVMMLCDVNVTRIGSGLTFNGSSTPTMDARELGSILYDRAILNFGYVENTGCAQADECSIYIEYEAVMLDNSNTTTGEQYWVSAGAEYNNEDEVWVGQAAFTAMNNDTSVPTPPSFNFTGPSTLPIGSSALFQVDMYLPNPSANLNFDAFAPLNTSSVMSICSARIKYLSDNFECGFDASAVSKDLQEYQSGIGYKSGRLSIGTVVNKGSRDDDNKMSDNLISVEFSASMFDDTSLIGQKYSVGSAFEIGSSQIWSGLLEVTAASAVDASSMPEPPVSFETPGGGYQIPKGDPLVMTMKLEIPKSSTSQIIVETRTPFQNSAKFQLCSISIKSIGENMPCLNKESKKAVYASRATDSSYADIGVLDLGSVSNLNINTDAGSPDTITFNIIVTALEHPDVTDTSQHSVSVFVTYGDGKQFTKSEKVTISGQSTTTVLTNSTSPAFNMSYVYGDVNVGVGTATKVKLEMTTNRSVTYPMMNLEFIMPTDNSSAMFSVCRVKVESAGKNLPCVTPDWVSSNVEYISKFNHDNNDKAVLSLGSVCNYQEVDEEEEDKLIITFDVQIEDHKDLLHGTKEWISAGNQFSEETLWVGQLALVVQRGASISPSVQPYVSLIKNTTLASSPVGFPTVYTVLVKVPPRENVQLKVDVMSAQDGLYVCGLRIIEVGENMPCVTKRTEPTFTKFSGGGNDAGSIDIGIVSNTGSQTLVSKDYYDNNTILIEIIMQLSTNTMLVTDGGSYSFDVHVQYNSLGGKIQLNSQLLTATHDRTVANLTTIQSGVNATLYVGSIVGNNSDTSVAKGETKRVLMDVVFPDGQTQDVTVKFFTSISDVDQMEICDAGIVFVGSNFPCVDKTLSNQTIEKRTGSQTNNVVTFHIGFLCSSSIKSGDESTNKITFEAAVRLLPSSTKQNGNSIPFHAAVNVNDMEIYVAQCNFTVSDTFNESSASTLNETSLSVNVSDAVIDMGIGSQTTIPIVLEIPEMTSSRVLFDVNLPTNDTAVAIVKDIRFSNAGVNLGCMYENAVLGLEFTKSFNSSLDNCENNRATLHLGIVTNTGLSTRKGTNSSDDNNIYLEVDVMMLDPTSADNGTEFYFAFGATLGDKLLIYDKTVRVARNSTEKPILEMTSSVNNSASTMTNIAIDSVLKHSNHSSATAVNASMVFYLPPYMKYKTYQSSIPPSSISFDNGVVLFQFYRFILCEVIELRLSIEPNNTVDVPGDVMTDNTIIAYESGAQMVHRTGSSYADGEFFSSDMKCINFSTSVTQTDQCSDPLGMENGVIADCQLSASIENNPERPPSHGRYKGTSAWSPFNRGERFKNNRYFQVYFGNKTVVTKIKIQIGTGFTIHPIETTLRYSDDGNSWQTGETAVLDPASSEKTLYVTNLVEARFLRVYIDRDNSGVNNPPNIGLKFEFYGCYKSADHTPSNVCSSNPTTSYPNDFSFRNFLVVNGKVYACDLNPDSVDLKQRCHSSTDGVKWTELNKQVASMLGYDSETNRLYAYGNDKLSTLMSSDNGVTWSAIPRDYYVEERRKVTFSYAQKIPWVDETDLNAATPSPTYQKSNWGATYTGLWKKTSGIWNRELEWDSCCI